MYNHKKEFKVFSNMNISLFANFTSKQDADATIDEVAGMIRCDARVAAVTAGYRATGLRSVKEGSPLFSVACRFGGGKANTCVKAVTGLSLVDVDHADAAQLPAIRAKAVADPHTMLCYVTISGRGLRIIYRYELNGDFALKQQKKYYIKPFTTGNDYYARLLGTATDRQCKNVTRLSAMAHDPDVYFNPEAEPFTAQWVDERWGEAVAGDRESRRRKRELARIQACYTATILPEVTAAGATYAPGCHNDFVMRVGYELNKWGFDRELAVEWGVKTFADYADAAQVITSCYTHTGEFGTRGRSRPPRRYGDAGGGCDASVASVDDIKHFLDDNIRLRFNVILMQAEYYHEESDCWQPVTDRVVNSLWSRMSAGRKVNIADMFRVIESDYSPPFHPMRDYLEALPAWNADTGPDYIRELAGSVTVRGGRGQQERFLRYLCKWLVAMVAAWVDDTVVNNVILVLIGEQGAYKTTWFNYLLPPPLKQYFYTKTNANRMSKDELITLTKYALVCCEELDTMRPAELNQLKAAVTMPAVDERAAYARFHEHRQHIASFCGTGNNTQFLTDATGNRRWLPFEVENIVSPRASPFCHDGIYSQAYALWRSGFRFWFSKEEILELNRHNAQFETPNIERELVMLYFRQPAETEHGQFVTAARAMQIIGAGLTQKLSSVNVGRALTELGFRRVRYGGVRGYLVVARNGDEMQQVQRIMAVNAADDDRPDD